MSELISGKEALRELLCGKKVERFYKSEWEDLTADDPIDVFFTSESFRLKPRTITINGIEVPAPFEPKDGDVYFYLTNFYECGYDSRVYNSKVGMFYHTQAWRTRGEIMQVVAALRSIFGKK